MKGIRRNWFVLPSWEIRFAERLETTPEPSEKELEILRDLKDRTARAHAGE